MMETNSVFKSVEGREKIRTYYNHVLSYFPVNQKYVDTSYGKTFILEAGNPEHQPILLLHGSCSNSAFWFGEISALSEKFHVYAVDIIGEAGNSEENRLDTSSDAYALWIKALLHLLAIQHVIVMGNSLGGWMALKFATAFPERTAKLVLIATSGIMPPRPTFLSQSLESATQGGEGMKALNEVVVGENSIPQEVKDFINLILENYNPMTGALPIFTDKQLGKLNMPVLSIAGENDYTVEAEKTSQRLSALVPKAEVHLLRDCGHVIMNVTDIIIPFLIKSGC